MAFDLSVGGGKTVRVTEPTRAQFPGNLGGAVSYSMAAVVYKALEVMGGAVGAFVAGMGVQLLDRLEPSLVKYTAPLIDLVLKQADLDPDLRRFFTQLKAPTDAGAAALLAGMASSAGGAVYGSFLDVLLSGVHQSLLRLIRPTIPDVSSLMAMQRRGVIDPGFVTQMMSQLGYRDSFINAYREISQVRAGMGDWIEGYIRGNVSGGALTAEATKQGVPVEVTNLLIANRANLLQFDDLLRLVYRGHMSQAQLVDLMRKQGWTELDTLRRVQSVQPLPPLADAITMAVREAWRDDVAAAWGYDEDYPAQVGDHLAKLGFAPEWAKRYWRAHWELPSITYAIEMTHRGIITPAQFKDLLRIADYPAGWRDRMLRAIYSPLTRVDARRMYGLGVLDREGVKQAYRELGYDDTNAERLAEFTVRYESAKGESKPEEYKELTLGLIQQAYLKSIISAEEFRARVGELPYPAGEVELLLKITDARKVIEKTPDYTVEYRRDVKAIVERAYYKGTLSEFTAREYLTLAGLGEEEIGYSLAANDLARIEAVREAELKIVGDAYQARAITRVEAVERLGQMDIPAREQERLFTDWAIPRDLGTRRLTEAQYRLALTREIIDPEYYEESLRGLGYSDVDVAILVKLATPVEE